MPGGAFLFFVLALQPVLRYGLSMLDTVLNTNVAPAGSRLRFNVAQRVPTRNPAGVVSASIEKMRVSKQDFDAGFRVVLTVRAGGELFALSHFMSGMGSDQADRLIARVTATGEVNLDHWTWTPGHSATAPVLACVCRHTAVRRKLIAEV